MEIIERGDSREALNNQQSTINCASSLDAALSIVLTRNGGIATKERNFMTTFLCCVV